MVDASTMHKQVLVLQMVGRFRTLGHVPRGPRSAAASGEAVHRRSRPRDVRLHRGRPGHRVRCRLVQGRRRPDAPVGARRRAARHLLPHARRRVHVHLGHADQALHPAAPGADPVEADLLAGAAAPHPRAPDRGGDAGALPAHEVRRPEALLRRGRAHDDPDARPPDPEGGRAGRAGNGDRDGPPGAPQRARQHAGQDAGGPVLRVRGQAGAGALRRRREVPPGLFVGRGHARRPDARDARVQPVASRGGESRRRGLGARAAAPTRRRVGRPGAAGAHPRRRRGRRAGCDAGNPEHGADPRLLHGRDHSHRRQQPDRLHHVGSARHARHDLLHRHRQDGGGADPPRQWRRPRGLPARDRDRDGLPAAVPQGRLHRPRLLPPARAQRGRRADDHAAADVQEDRAASRHAQAVRRQADRGRRGQARRARDDDRDLSRRDGQGPAHQHDDPVELQARPHGRLVAVQGARLDHRLRREGAAEGAQGAGQEAR